MAMSAGARYADARLTRIVQHVYGIAGGDYVPMAAPKHPDAAGDVVLTSDVEQVGLGIRTLVNGAWGFAAAPLWIGEPAQRESISALAKDAVRQAKATAASGFPPVELAPVTAATGHWSTPIAIDPFAIPIEEKIAAVGYWKAQATSAGVQFGSRGTHRISFAREERALATSEGTLNTQVFYDTGGSIIIELPNGRLKRRRGGGLEMPVGLPLEGISHRGKGWELFDEVNMRQQFEYMREELPRRFELRERSQSGSIGRYTVVCDGVTMASIVERTLGTAIQLDRALSYEANASGTSFITNPLEAVGNLRIAPESVTVTANRTAPTQLATVRWDDEGTEPQPFTLLRDGVLTDFQTNREQAAWLAPYYQKIGRPMRSNGCAAAESALFITMQHMPNLALEPVRDGPGIDALVANVKDGIYIERGKVTQMDSQGRSGTVGAAWGDRAARTRKITNGRLGAELNGVVLMFDTVDLWKRVAAVGGESTRGTLNTTGYDIAWSLFGSPAEGIPKGIPAQITGHTTQAAAAVIANQPLIDPRRKA
jgi:TldD protein